jgi:DDE superfamily endonuclease
LAAGQALDHQPRSGVRTGKKQRDRLIRLAAQQPARVLGYLDECWWSRLHQPQMYAWTDTASVRWQQRSVSKADPAPKALACYGLLRQDTAQRWLRFVTGRPVSHVTTAYLAWLCERLTTEGKRALLLIWDNASWHRSHEVRTWINGHHRQAKRAGGVRIVACKLPVKSPWLNPIEPKWVHGKRAVVEPERLLTAPELVTRVYEHYGCEPWPHLTQHAP